MSQEVYLQNLPFGWSSVRLKSLLESLESGRREISDSDDFEGQILSIGGEHIGWKGELLLHNPRYISYDFYSKMSSGQIQENDILLVKDGATIGKTAIVEDFPVDKAAVNEHVFILRFFKECHPKFYFYFIQSEIGQEQIKLQIRGSAQPGLNSDFRHTVLAPFPPFDLQLQIADYLDRETARVDALIAAKEQLLTLLEEKRQALITQAVTKGLDTSVPMRDSRVAWLGEVPEHWKVTRLKFVAEVRGGLAIGKNYQSAFLQEFPYLRVANVQDGQLNLIEIKKVLIPPDEAKLYLLQSGDVLMNEGGDADKLGRGCIWKGEIIPCLHQNHVFAVRPFQVSSEWLNLWTSSSIAKNYFESRAKQSTNLASISSTSIKELFMPLPHQSEQHEIVEFVKRESNKLNYLRNITLKTIVLLKERRSALIAAAVTGQIDMNEQS